MSTNNLQPTRKGRIRIWQCLKYRKPRDRKRELIWTGELIGVTGLREEWTEAKQKSYILNLADYWATFTGWPIEDLGRHEKYDDPERT